MNSRDQGSSREQSVVYSTMFYL